MLLYYSFHQQYNNFGGNIIQTNHDALVMFDNTHKRLLYRWNDTTNRYTSGDGLTMEHRSVVLTAIPAHNMAQVLDLSNTCNKLGI